MSFLYTESGCLHSNCLWRLCEISQVWRWVNNQAFLTSFTLSVTCWTLPQYCWSPLASAVALAFIRASGRLTGSFMTKASSERRLKFGPLKRSSFWSTRSDFLKIQSSRLTWKEQDTASGVLMEGEEQRGAQGDYGYKNTGRGRASTRGACLTATPLATALSRWDGYRETPLSDRLSRSTCRRRKDAPLEGLTSTLRAFSSGKRMQKWKASIWPQGTNMTALKTHNREVCYLRRRLRWFFSQRPRGKGYGWGTCSRWPVNNIRWAASLPEELPENGEALRVVRF